MAPDALRSRQPLERCPSKSSAPGPRVPPLIGVLPQMGMARTQSWETWEWTKGPTKRSIVIFRKFLTMENGCIGTHKSNLGHCLTIIYVAKGIFADVKYSINVYLCYLDQTAMKLEQTLEEQHDHRGDDH